MLKGTATDIAVYGLRGLASKNGRSIPEEAVVQAKRIADSGYDGDGVVSSADVLAAAVVLNPGDIYVEGLKGTSGIGRVLRQTTRNQIRTMRDNHQEEHIDPLKQAYRFLTGKEF